MISRKGSSVSNRGEKTSGKRLTQEEIYKQQKIAKYERIKKMNMLGYGNINVEDIPDEAPIVPKPATQARTCTINVNGVGSIMFNIYSGDSFSVESFCIEQEAMEDDISGVLPNDFPKPLRGGSISFPIVLMNVGFKIFHGAFVLDDEGHFHILVDSNCKDQQTLVYYGGQKFFIERNILPLKIEINTRIDEPEVFE